MSKTICVYSSSSSTLQQSYYDLATALGKAMATSGQTLLFGGGLRGLMGATAQAVHQYHGRVIGVIPEALNLPGVVYEACDELIVTKDLRTRKAVMDQRSDAFIALPGGYGTLEELLEIITLKQLRYHNKPIIILDDNGFYNQLLAQFDTVISESFARPQCKQLYQVTASPQKALNYIQHYQPLVIEEKWLT